MMREAAELARDHLDPREAARLFAVHRGVGGRRAWHGSAPASTLAGRPLPTSGPATSPRAEDLLGRPGLKVRAGPAPGPPGPRSRRASGCCSRAGDMRGAWELLSSYDGTFPSLAEPLAAARQWLAAPRWTSPPPSAPCSAPPPARTAQPRAAARPLHPGSPARAARRPPRRRGGVAAHRRLRLLLPGRRARACRRRRSRRTAQRASRTTGQAAEEAAGIEVIAHRPRRPLRARARSSAAAAWAWSTRRSDKRLGRTVAIKVLNTRQHTPEAIRRFEREARAAAALSHPGIVHIYDFDRGFGSFFISMEFVAGPTLNQLLTRGAAVRAPPPR